MRPTWKRRLSWLFSAGQLITLAAVASWILAPTSTDERVARANIMGAIVPVSFVGLVWLGRARRVESERRRIRRVLGVPEVVDVPELQVERRVELPHERLGPASAMSASASDRVEEAENARFAELLIDYYAHALTHARASAWTCTAFSIFGGLLLLSGLGLSVWQNRNGSPAVGAGLSSAAGVVTSTIGLLFQRDARQALAHLQGQTEGLRQDSAARRQMARALRLLGSVTDEELQNQLRAGLIVKLASAQLGDFPLPGVEHPAPPSAAETGAGTTPAAKRAAARKSAPAKPGSE